MCIRDRDCTSQTGSDPQSFFFLLFHYFFTTLYPVSYTHLDVYKRQALYSGTFRQQVHPVGAPTEGDFPQCGEIFQREEINCCPLRLIFPVHISTCQSFQQLRRLNIHQFYLICLIKGGIRNALPHKNSGDRAVSYTHLDVYKRQRLYLAVLMLISGRLYQ